MPRLYFDAHATTPCDPQVVEAMLPFFSGQFGNAASLQHAFGWEAQQAVESARQHVADLVGARLRDVIFTSGATEANNLAICGVIEAALTSGRPGSPTGGSRPALPDSRPSTHVPHVVTVVTEHPAILEPCAELESRGVRLTRVPVRAGGLVDLGVMAVAITPGTTLVSVMAGNNEIGVIQPLADIDMAAMGIDLLSYTAHKIYGPKGAGALVVRRASKVAIEPRQRGGGHERGLRSGTLNVPGIVGFGEAARLAKARRSTDAARLATLRDRLWGRLRSALRDVHLRGAEHPRLPHNLNVGFDGLTGRDLVLGLTDVAVSPGAACASTSAAPSHVLMALGLTEAEARSSLRFGLLRTTTEAEVDDLAERVIALVTALRAGRERRG